jgi:hypothetical protein
MALSDRPAERHRQVAGLFTERVCGTRSWNMRNTWNNGGHAEEADTVGR